MYNSIEIPDSDEDMLELTIDLPIESSAAEINEHTPKKQRKISVSSAAETNTATTPGSTSSETTNSSPLNSNKDSNTTHQVRHRSRKAQLTVRNGLENEIQFETIPVDDETPAAQEQRVKENERVSTLIANMLNTDEMETVMQRIANERVRCNFLLTSYNLPDMHFSLSTPLEMLKFQFQERLKLRRERLNAPNATKPIVTNKNKSEQLEQT
ncbi:uncharacterized protein LOC6580866 [Drosophila mojavensis]|uniref:uncharacterized protein LOC6580866 n=1 Tax=Drosophila mojavensis TaxID=7230 RepID=UPI001CD10196|nr:uncharacterized protein LOC6580866 [Drosophila mojavensis]XP_043867254.1 uncharacterized protein LOC6580866 [Drosophila mojavensis]XP_043867255.1 uncharacterized protein LOC6580866 [Drosophila mojavensis]